MAGRLARTAAAGVAVLFAATGCVGPMSSPPASALRPAPNPSDEWSASPATPEPSSSPEPTAETGTSPSPVGALFPKTIAGVEVVARPIQPSANDPILTPAMLDTIAAAAGIPAGGLTIVEAVPDDESAELGPLRILALSAPVDPQLLLGAYLVSLPDFGAFETSISVDSFAVASQRALTVLLGATTLYPAEEALYLIGFGTPLDASREEVEKPLRELYEHGVDFRKLLSTVVGELPPRLTPMAAPEPRGSSGSLETPEPVRALEARLPSEVAGHEVETGSMRMSAEMEPGLVELAADPVVKLLDLPIEDGAVAFAHADGLNTFTVLANTFDGIEDGKQLEAAFLAFAFSVGGVSFTTFKADTVDRSPYLLTDSWSVASHEDMFLLMLYFDIGDCFDQCDTSSRPPLVDLVEATLSGLP